MNQLRSIPGTIAVCGIVIGWIAYAALIDHIEGARRWLKQKI